MERRPHEEEADRGEELVARPLHARGDPHEPVDALGGGAVLCAERSLQRGEARVLERLALQPGEEQGEHAQLRGGALDAAEDARDAIAEEPHERPLGEHHGEERQRAGPRRRHAQAVAAAASASASAAGRTKAGRRGAASPQAASPAGSTLGADVLAEHGEVLAQVEPRRERGDGALARPDLGGRSGVEQPRREPLLARAGAGGAEELEERPRPEEIEIGA